MNTRFTIHLFYLIVGVSIGDQPDGDAPEVFSLSVSKEYRRKGIAQHLISVLLAKLKEINADEITLAVKNDDE